MVVYLNTAGTPSTTASGLGGGTSRVMSSLAVLADNPESNKSRSQKEDSSQESEGHIGLVLPTSILRSHISPSPNGSTVVILVCICEQSEGNDPEDEEDQIHRPFCERGEEWEEEEEREKD